MNNVNASIQCECRRAQAYWLAWRQLPLEERRVLPRMWLHLQIASLGLRFLGWKRTLGLLSRCPVRLYRGIATPTQLAELMLKSARYSPTRPTCLAQAMTLRCILHDFGFWPAKLVLGWKAHKQFSAHAWVDCQGQALLVSRNELSQYVRFFEQ